MALRYWLPTGTHSTAIGSQAVYAPANLWKDSEPESIFNDHDYFFVTSATDPLTPVYDQGGWWEPSTASAHSVYNPLVCTTLSVSL